jgi:hypothetical protein
MKVIDIIQDNNRLVALFKLKNSYDRELFKHVVQALCSNYCFSPNIPDDTLAGIPLKVEVTVIIKEMELCFEYEIHNKH